MNTEPVEVLEASIMTDVSNEISIDFPSSSLLSSSSFTETSATLPNELGRSDCDGSWTSGVVSSSLLSDDLEEVSSFTVLLELLVVVLDAVVGGLVAALSSFFAAPTVLGLTPAVLETADVGTAGFFAEVLLPVVVSFVFLGS